MSSSNNARELLLDAARPSPNSGIESLRRSDAVRNDGPPYDVAQLRQIIDGVVSCMGVANISAATGVPAEVVIDAVKRLGTWLTHVHGGAGLTTVKEADMVQPPLLQVLAPRTNAAQKIKDPKKRKAAAAKAEAKAIKKGHVVVVPAGFEPKAAGSDLRKSLAAIVAWRPGNAELTRFLAREFREVRQTLEFSYLTSVRKFAEIGRLNEIGLINPNGTEFNRLVVEAFDLLEVTRIDAMSGLAELCGTNRDPEALRRAVAKIRPLFEAEAAKLDRVVAILADPNVAASSARTVDKELRWLASRVVANPSSFCVAHIGQLNVGQVRRIAEMNSIEVDAVGRAEESRIRARLTELGLGADADQLIPEALRAEKGGYDQVFWSAIERRSAGDPDWESELIEAAEEALELA